MPFNPVVVYKIFFCVQNLKLDFFCEIEFFFFFIFDFF